MTWVKNSVVKLASSYPRPKLFSLLLVCFRLLALGIYGFNVFQAFHKYDEGHVVELMDRMMEEAVDADILVKMFALAFQCAAPIRNDRPEMKSVAEQLWAIRADYLKSSRQG